MSNMVDSLIIRSFGSKLSSLQLNLRAGGDAAAGESESDGDAQAAAAEEDADVVDAPSDATAAADAAAGAAEAFSFPDAEHDVGECCVEDVFLTSAFNSLFSRSSSSILLRSAAVSAASIVLRFRVDLTVSCNWISFDGMPTPFQSSRRQELFVCISLFWRPPLVPAVLFLFSFSKMSTSFPGTQGVSFCF